MTEFVVSVAFVFLAIFVFVPSFGKLLDLQFQNIMSSRYIAWERTVWFDQITNDNRDDFVVSNDAFESVAIRSDEDILNSAENRFFYKHGRLLPVFIDETDTELPAGKTTGLWNYTQSKKTMYGGTTVETGSFDAQSTPGIAYGVLDVVGQGLSAVKEPIDFLLNLIGNENEDLFELPLMNGEKSFYSPVVQTRLNIGNAHGKGESYWDRDETSGQFNSGIESALFQNWDGVLESRSAILADGWNAQSLKHYQDRADDYVPTTVFDNDIFNTIKTIASILEGGPFETPISSGSAIQKLDFGEVGITPMPSTDGKPSDVSCEDGACTYQ
jgi:hypothetical protein